MTTLDATSRAWLRGAMPGMAAAVDAEGRPQTARIFAVFADDVADALYLYMPRSSSAAFFAAITARGRAAANFIELPSYRSRMFRGPCVVVEAPHTPATVEAWHKDVGVCFTRVGMPPDGAETMLGHYPASRDMVVLRLAVEACYDQTPRRHAGCAV